MTKSITKTPVKKLKWNPKTIHIIKKKSRKEEQKPKTQTEGQCQTANE